MTCIDIIKLLQEIDDYVLLKKSHEFPDYSSGSDVDLLVMDKDSAIKKVVDYYESALSTLGELKVTCKGYHYHMDFLINDQLDLRVDLIHNLSFYTKISVKNSFIIKIFKDRQIISYKNGSVYIPSQVDDLTIRYFEYLEYFDRFPNKIKHLDYLCDVKDESVKKDFINNTHRFISFKRSEWISQINIMKFPKSRKKALENIWSNFKYIIKASLRQWLN